MEQLYPVCVCLVFRGWDSQQVIIWHSEFLLHLSCYIWELEVQGGGLTQLGVISEHHRNNQPSKLNRTQELPKGIWAMTKMLFSENTYLYGHS